MITFLTQAAPADAGSPFMIYFLLIMLVVMFATSLMTRSKEKKEAKLLLDNLEIGDKIMTTAGIIGIVTDLKGNDFVIETGNSRTSIMLTKQALYKNMSAEERLAKAKADKKSGKAPNKKEAKSTKKEAKADNVKEIEETEDKK